MAKVTDHVIYDVLLVADVPPAESFSINMAIVDDAAIPVDLRVRQVSPTSYTEDLPVGSLSREYATIYFSQDLTAEALLFGRRVTADTAPYYVFGPGFSTDVAAWKAITDGEFRVTDSESNDVDVVGLDFSAITAIDQVLDLITDALAALTTPAVVGLDDATVDVDAVGRRGIYMPIAVAGADSPTIAVSAVPAGTGTDLSTLFDVVNGISAAGFDAETILESFDAIREVNDTFYNVEPVRATDVDNLSLAGAVQGLKKTCTLITSDPNSYNPTSTTDLGAKCKALSYDRALVIYHSKKATEFAGAAIEGRLMPTDEGAVNYAFSTLSGVTSDPLSVSNRQALKDKLVSYFETVGSSTYLYNGITSGNVEKRLIRGIDWFESVCQNENFALLLNSDVLGFDNETITAIEGILRKYSEQAFERKIFVNTRERPFVITLPDADQFTQAERASHRMTIENAFTGFVNSAVNDILVRGSVTI